MCDASYVTWKYRQCLKYCVIFASNRQCINYCVIFANKYIPKIYRGPDSIKVVPDCIPGWRGFIIDLTVFSGYVVHGPLV